MTKYTITEEYMDWLLKEHARKVVGKILKRVDIVDAKPLLKKCIKEITYESFRDLGDIIAAVDKGHEAEQWDFKNKNKNQGRV